MLRAPVSEQRERDSTHTETRREALGRFLRRRREALTPEQVGISSHRGRRTPGLRREEVAFLADIGVKWYARLEAGDEIQPSAATLTGIAVALRLSTAELEYMLDLAGLHKQSLPHGDVATIPQPLREFVGTARGVATTLCDRILTPLLWNFTAEMMFGHSRFTNPIERNGLVRALYDADFIACLGEERQDLLLSAVGMFRLNYSSTSPSPYAAEVYERVKHHALFADAWERRVVANELTHRTITVRNHPVVGKLEMFAVDLAAAMRPDLFLRIFIPATDDASAKFARLERIAPGETAPVSSLRAG
jgi:transcriptional regulator with XRE-family HTH domain